MGNKPVTKLRLADLEKIRQSTKFNEAEIRINTSKN